MKKNLYYRTMFKRTNLIKEFVLNIFLAIASYPRMVLEVFLRKNFGERYFTLGSAITVAIILIVLPFMFFGTKLTFGSNVKMSSFFADYTTWYLFVTAFGFFSLVRWLEMKRNPSVFDFEKFSLYSGNIHPSLFTLKLFGTPNVRTVETVYEPLIGFVAGVIFWWFGQPLGIFLMVCSVLYSLSYVGAYYQGDHFVMDKIDEMICNEEMFNSFVEDMDASETRGVRFYGRKPASDEVRRRVVKSFIDDDEEVLIAQ